MSKRRHFHLIRGREQSFKRTQPLPDLHAGTRQAALHLTSYGLTAEEAAPVVEALSRRPKQWVDFMMKFELALERPDPKRAFSSGLTIAGAYAVGGLVPLVPYMLIPVAALGLSWSIACTLLALLLFGYIKGGFTGTGRVRSAVQTMLIGGIAASVAFAIARLWHSGVAWRSLRTIGAALRLASADHTPACAVQKQKRRPLGGHRHVERRV